MALRDVTRGAVERALADFDRLGRQAFLARAGFGEAAGSFINRGVRRYDAKATVGVAHGYDRPDLGPFRPKDFSRGEAAVARHLEALGFDVERSPRNPRWAEEELILALDLYLRAGLLDDRDEAVVALSRHLNDLTIHDERPDALRFRNPNGVALKLANFAAFDPNYPGRGMTRGGKRDAEVWDRYAEDEDALAEAAAAIREGRAPPPAQLAEPVRLRVTKVEAQHVERFRVSVPDGDHEATRREQGLVLAYRDHLESKGHTVTRHTYTLSGSGATLACDLVDETARVLYEAKGNVLRTSVRMAVGQLLDYRRFEPTSSGGGRSSPPMRLGVLLPRDPARDLIDLIRSVPASTVWRTHDGFKDIA